MFSNKLKCVYTLYAYTNSMEFYDKNKTWITIRQPRKKNILLKLNSVCATSRFHILPLLHEEHHSQKYQTWSMGSSMGG